MLDLEDYDKADRYRLELVLASIDKKIQEFKDSSELGYVDNELQEECKFEE